MEKYMGNKSKFCDVIYNEISKYIDLRGRTFFDPFSGTTNVSRYFKKNGANIICNDINDFSFVLAKTYIENCEIPDFKRLYEKNDYFLSRLKELDEKDEIDLKINKLIKENKYTSNLEYTSKLYRRRYLEVLAYLTYFCDERDYSGIDYFLFQDNYCEGGKNSRYINLVYKKTLDNILERSNDLPSAKIINKFYKYPYKEKYLSDLTKQLIDEGRNEDSERVQIIIDKGNVVGERRFFSLSHAKRLDHILNTICYWRNNNYITDNEYYILITALIETVTIFSNTSATYQAFYKDYRANTLQDFRLIIPELDTTKIKSSVFQEDAYSLMTKIEADVMYLDPPYNWRQYDSNYHLLNTVARFNDIDDKTKFFKQIVGASGENRIQKLKYTSFNKRATFEKLLLNRIDNSKCKVVALSYSDSESNHKREGIDITLKQITDFFGDKTKFASYKVVKVDSRNFESRKGNKKESIHELLFIAIRK